MTFNMLGLAEPITRALIEARYSTPTPIQAAGIPVVLSGRDLIGIAQTGTGKTAAFALPILNHLAASPKRPEPKSCRVLVLSPTRELSGQIVESFRTYGRHLRVSVTLAIGGVPMGKQVRTLARGIDVLVATPGRLLDLCQSRALRLDQVEIMVLDEADRMLDMGFIVDIRRVVAMLPKKRQTLFFSATMPPEIAELARGMLTDPARVAVTPPATTVERVEQRGVHVPRGEKPALLAATLRSEPVDRALIFTRTKRGADRVVQSLVRAGIEADAIHGNKSQGQRERVLAAFRDGSIRTLVATDIAARGIDVTGISHVINYDMPEVPEAYVHRIGRTARAGKEGIAISFCAPDELSSLRAIEKLIGLQILPSVPGERNLSPKAPRQARGAGKPRSENRPGRNRRPHSGGRQDSGRERGSRQERPQTHNPAELGQIPFLKPARRGDGSASRPGRSG